MKTDKLFYDEFHLAGCQYWDVTEAWDKLRIVLKVKLEREMDNRYDPDAIAVLLPCTDDEEDKEFYKLGYVPRSHNGDLAKPRASVGSGIWGVKCWEGEYGIIRL